jgi:spore coat polysaccharide biosynthesis protein SpsF (cytidylyltransferase family)
MYFREIYIDIDQDYDTFDTSKTAQFIRRNVEIFNKNFVNRIDKIEIRKSSSGHVHLKVYLESPVRFLEMMQIRALLHDDVYRLAIDLRRSFIQGEQETNRIFSSKWKNGEEFHAGEWREWK